MKILLLFTVTFMIFFLFLLPIIWPFGIGSKMSAEAIGFAYGSWYIMCFIFALVWGALVERRGCWFFDNK